MRRRQPLPRLWLMTDERQGEGLWRALERLPRGAGIIFRHYSLPAGERRALFERIKPVARQKRLMLLLAGSAGEARAWGADGSHGRGSRRSLGLRSAPVHDLAEIRRSSRLAPIPGRRRSAVSDSGFSRKKRGSRSSRLEA